MPSVMMGLLDAKRLAWALVPHASKDDVTPALKSIVIGGDHEHYAYASDRYTVGRYDLSNIVEKFPDEEFHIPRDVLSAIRSLGPSSLVHELINYRVVFTTMERGKVKYIQAKVLWHNEAEGDMVHWMRTWSMPGTRGFPGSRFNSSIKFPPVEKIFRQVKRGKDATVLIGPEQLTKFTGYAKSINEKMLITLTEGSNESKLAPILVEIGPRFKGLLQPNLLLDRRPFGADLVAENEALDKLAAAEAEGKDS